MIIPTHLRFCLSAGVTCTFDGTMTYIEDITIFSHNEAKWRGGESHYDMHLYVFRALGINMRRKRFRVTVLPNRSTTRYRSTIFSIL